MGKDKIRERHGKVKHRAQERNTLIPCQNENFQMLIILQYRGIYKEVQRYVNFKI